VRTRRDRRVIAGSLRGHRDGGHRGRHAQNIRSTTHGVELPAQMPGFRRCPSAQNTRREGTTP
jgi:hypothetical protein